MSFRTISITNRCKLSHSLNYLVIRGEEEKRIHLSEIAKLIIQSTQVAITSSLMAELSSRKIKLIICNNKHNPEAELVSYYGAHNSSQRIFEQIHWNAEFLPVIWQKIVQLKISNQGHVLAKHGHHEKAQQLFNYATEVEFGDRSNREGHAAKVYFNSLFGMGFSRSKENDINAYLNYGYTILLSMFNREISAKGYLTQIGIHHRNEYNDFNFSCDLMEPLRPIVDDYACSGVLTSENFRSKLNNLGTLSLVYDQKKTYLEYAISLYVQDVIRAINQQDVNYIINFESYEL